MPVARVPLSTEPIDGTATVINYDRYAALFMRPEYRLTVSKIQRRGYTRGRVLDIGTGSGRLAQALASAKGSEWQVTALDLSAGMLRLAQSKFQAAACAKTIDCVQATADTLPFPDNAFDVVTSYASLHHWQKPARVFDEIWRVTRAGGLILIRDNRRMLGNPAYRMGVGLISLFMKKEEKGRWPKSILASYTLEEVRQLLQSTHMNQAKVRADMAGFDLCIETHKTAG